MKNIILLLLFSTFIYLRKAEIIKLINQTKIHCISEENIQSAIFIIPPILDKTDLRKHSTNNIKLNNEWINYSSEKSHTEAIFDKRWEDFQLEFKNEFLFDKFVTKSISMYGANHIFFSFYDDSDDPLEYRVITKVNKQWTSFTILYKEEDRIIRLFQNNELLFTLENQLLTKLRLTVDIKTYFKLHNYNFWQSFTKSPQFTDLEIAKNQMNYLGLYVALCSWCKLEFSSNIKNITILSTTKKDNELVNWQYYYFKTNINEDLHIRFMKTVTEDQEDGFWGLDIRYYQNTPNLVSYTINNPVILDPKDFECDFLNKSNITKASKTFHNLKKCQPGELGINCDITCSDILGKEFSCCNSYKICKKKDCFCGKNSDITQCDSVCSENQWDFNCQINDSENCDNDDKKDTSQTETDISANVEESSLDGKSDINTDLLWGILGLVLVLIILLLVFVVVLGLLLYKKNCKKNKTNLSYSNNASEDQELRSSEAQELENLETQELRSSEAQELENLETQKLRSSEDQELKRSEDQKLKSSKNQKLRRSI